MKYLKSQNTYRLYFIIEVKRSKERSIIKFKNNHREMPTHYVDCKEDLVSIDNVMISEDNKMAACGILYGENCRKKCITETVAW